ncbi:hypothetical protein ACYEXS_19580 [Paenibacillus sp. MAH-36]|uniref:Uncharacterized protein n=1 Tax=Paenibacillus violae TaxID=3077234 RepID=A0ABU3R7W0_9BACL|nr:hypothetical protein [Paenibacillus sp. PFR10]MDU0200146.1 hypothetical protein [Paenibacillus sp. PFR10]
MHNDHYGRRDITREGSPPGPVKTYTLSAEELTELRARTAINDVRNSDGGKVKSPVNNFKVRGPICDIRN